MSSIKYRLVLNYMFIILITVLILELFLISSIRKNYYKNLEDTLVNQLQTATDLYERYFSEATLQENVLNDVDTFYRQVTAQVEIIDMEGNMIFNSLGTIADPVTEMEDIRAALEGGKGIWVGRIPGSTEKVMAATYPIIVAEEQVGILRFVTSLQEVNRAIKSVAFMYISFGVTVIIFSGIVSVFLARTITYPLKKVTLVAAEMARGNFKVKSMHRSRDEIGKLSETLNYLGSEILKRDELKNDFISSVSHELRTPLTSIKGWAVTLKQGYENNELLQDGLAIIEKESDRLSGMVAELLDFSKFVSGKITLKKEQVDLTKLLEHLHMQLTPRALREEIDFQIRHEEETAFLYTDADRLKQVFINLLDNAFKFTAPGGQVSLIAAPADQEYCFYVEDNGCGIPAEELPKVKEKFYKGRSSQAQSGIGLSLSDEIIRLMKGEMEIASEVGRGTRVTIRLPRGIEADKI
jgi:signal transduction histidine kinase